MRPFLLAALIFVLPGGTSAGLAQPRRVVLYGWGEKIVHVGDLPPAVRAELRKEINQDLAIGFLYKHTFLIVDGFDFWTWNGRHVLFHGDSYSDLTDQDFLQLLGAPIFRHRHARGGT